MRSARSRRRRAGGRADHGVLDERRGRHRRGAISIKAREIAREFGAEAVVIVSLRPTEDGKGWNAHHSAYLEKDCGMNWETIAQAVHDTADSIETDEPIEMPEPS